LYAIKNQVLSKPILFCRKNTKAHKVFPAARQEALTGKTQRREDGSTELQAKEYATIFSVFQPSRSILRNKGSDLF
jgi:hypothetical protein